MWEEGSSSNKAVEIGDAGYTTVTGHLQAGMLVCQQADNSRQFPVGMRWFAFLPIYSKHLFAKFQVGSPLSAGLQTARKKLAPHNVLWNSYQRWKDELPFRNAAGDVKSVLCSGGKMMILLSRHTRKAWPGLKSVPEQEYSLEIPGSAAQSESSGCF